jgi:hypothetical protein
MFSAARSRRRCLEARLQNEKLRSRLALERAVADGVLGDEAARGARGNFRVDRGEVLLRLGATVVAVRANVARSAFTTKVPEPAVTRSPAFVAYAPSSTFPA